MDSVRVVSINEWLVSLAKQNGRTSRIPKDSAEFGERELQDAELEVDFHHETGVDALRELAIDRVANFFAKFRATLLDGRLFVRNQLELAYQLCFAGLDAHDQIIGDSVNNVLCLF